MKQFLELRYQKIRDIFKKKLSEAFFFELGLEKKLYFQKSKVIKKWIRDSKDILKILLINFEEIILHNPEAIAKS